ncbi:UV DNA damage repair endonuclease UvsE [Shouchella lehensis]|uniref:UV DNA damage endonuclease n=2 Tax=Shouchella lehensis TaxID=300825 RepID=A0A060M2C2_9BACI|nr:UV DNA damage repair endonuclease UvsE [Shouchella lehensis]AIC94708.1 UV DNA damage endonuclease [Shouchella lehensis G1]MBG9784417.1 UV damage repair endonuclease UvdE [Shouchella lehensis]RQW20568.1 UV DNA damage repair endonuclease UvsE [Bacillus sp. C1-1]TES50582.1 UV DNA damage repair endonuclease UvsE [Shouchella lehensis]
MRFGYACLNLTLETKMRTCRLQTMRNEGMAKIKELTMHNLDLVQEMVNWNEANHITFFRLSSEIIPFATHPEMDWAWDKDKDVLQRLEGIKKIGKQGGMRFSMHPGQYTVLNSPKEQVVTNAVNDLLYHERFLSLVGGTDIIIHTGGAYGDKEKAKATFAKSYKQLPDAVKMKIRLENDDKTFHTRDVLDIHEQCGVTVVFDIHHERCFHTKETELKKLFKHVCETWSMKPKLHISSGRSGEADPRHTDYIRREDYDLLVRVLDGTDADVMIEAKAKEKALLSLRESIMEGKEE